MDSQSLTRRQLQSLCKRNSIPANMTNIAMADALKSLDFVEGIEEISQPKESESAQSSIESPAKLEVTSPYVPPTGGRTTRRRTIAKEEPQTLQPMTRTRGTARKTQAKNKEESRADATETPTVVAQSSRRRVPVASACRKMESQFKECAEEDEKKGVPLTPVALEVTGRRRGLKKESEVRRVYSTRRSARLAEKNVEISREVKNEKPEILRSDLFMKEEGEGYNMEMNVKEVSDGVHEVSEITGIEVETSSEKNFRRVDVTEVSSGQKQDISDENDESHVEDKLSQNSETDYPNLEMDQCIDAGDEQLNVHCEAGSKLDGEIADETEPSNGSELDGEIADETEPSNGGNVAMTLNESNDHVEDGHDDVKRDEVGKENEMNPTNEVGNGVKQAGEEKPVGNIIAAEEEVSESVVANINWQLNCSETGTVDSTLHLNAEFLEMESNPIKGTECGVQKSSSREAQPLGKILCDEVENLQTEASEKAVDDAPSSDAVENVPASIKNSPIKHLGGSESAATVHSPMLQNADFLKEIKTSGIKAEPGSSIPPRFTEIDSSFTIQLNSLTTTKKSASKASATVKNIADVSDNKENIASCGSKVLTKESVKIAKDIAEKVDKNKDLSELSMRKLTKMLKEKLQITNKSSKDENGNKAITRPALQALPENRMGNKTESS
ncbi:uncharacterized protein [Primulina huaijiensis]|uniref:uncharacterized protein isoform X2 n=1 Tax=Primulina huaijiensis TaxID=1492673 RepID=UPI003CC77C7A